ncbi:MAG TPA: LysM peptidoglycan-binding domain-containing protein [Solirubrobacteraceae bacterium]|jgi:hypothetical protein|nr:LysM peptidoglycan-binding domain-containing protein [Solirubrobacteraceae bacterium]
MSFERAHLLLEDKTRIPFHFNPSTLRRERRASYTGCEALGQAAPTLEYQGTNSQSLSFDLLLHAQDGVNAGQVQQKIEALEALVEPSVEVPDSRQLRPQHLQLVWGQYTSPWLVCVSISTTIELFEADGTPLRAQIAIGLSQAMPEPGQQISEAGAPGQNPTTRATQRRRAHLVHAGETLAGIAWAHYHDPTRWRAIALANGIDDPLRLPVGSRLTVPLEGT